MLFEEIGELFHDMLLILLFLTKSAYRRVSTMLQRLDDAQGQIDERARQLR